MSMRTTMTWKGNLWIDDITEEMFLHAQLWTINTH